MGRLIGWVWMVGLASLAHAQPTPNDARGEFDAGVAHATRGEWAPAVEAFERSLALTPRAATAFNLVVALHHVDRPARLLEVAAMFDELATAPRYEAQRVRVEELRRWAQEASANLAATDERALEATSEPTRSPTSAEDAAPSPAVATREPESVEREGELGRETEAHSGSNETTHAATPSNEARAARTDAPRLEPASTRDDESPWSTRLRIAAMSLGATALVISLASASFAVVAARDLDEADPQATGFLSDALRYRRLRAASVHAAWSGGVALAASFALQRVRPKAARWALRALGLALGLAGAALAISPPRRLGDTTLTGARRTVGLVMVGLGTPLMSLAWGTR